jgi:hypothetical protein
MSRLPFQLRPRLIGERQKEDARLRPERGGKLARKTDRETRLSGPRGGRDDKVSGFGGQHGLMVRIGSKMRHRAP